MSRHVGRKQRWTQMTPSRYASSLGDVVYQDKAWYAVLNYQLPAPRPSESDLVQWLPCTERLGPFKRPRNAMVALERETTILKNRHGANVRILGTPASGG
jgi:hypothetical protein